MRAAERIARVAAVALFAAVPASAATFQIVNLDSAGEGFNDPTAVAPVTGNAGATRGAQRLNVFNAAAAVWGAALQSNVTIRVGANFDPLLPCDPGGAVLGAAGPETAHANFTGAPVASTWYVQAVANSRFGSDLDAANNDIGAVFNSTLDLGGSCLGGMTWWYGIGAPAPGGTVDLFTTVLHEIGHGVGFLSLHTLATGAMFGGQQDAYLRLLKDQTSGLLWPAMNNAQRLASSMNTGNLVWTGAAANSTVPGFSAGVNASQLRMFAPNPQQPGSSVSHFDTALTPNELMEPILTTTANDYATYRLLQDIGWQMRLIFKDGFKSGTDNFWSAAVP
jgi:hypothetical protein